MIDLGRVRGDTPGVEHVDFGGRGSDEAVRSSVHYYNSDDEIDALVDAVRRARTARA